MMTIKNVSNPLISVIVPVYNTVDYLPRCLNSLLSQTFKDFEILLIDDGSTDGSGQICDDYSRKDNRVVVFHKANEGVSIARNLGLSNSLGRKVVFVDSDDYVDSDYLSSLMRIDVDLVIGNTKLDAPNGVETRIDPVVRKDGFYNSDFEKLLLDQNLTSGSGPTAKLFDINIIRKYNLCFPVGVKLGEDTCFFFNYLRQCDSVCCLSSAHYSIVWRLDSASQFKYDFSTEYVGYQMNKKSIMSFLEHYDLINKFAATYVNWVVYFLHRALMAISSREELCSVTEDDWDFFFQYFNPQTRKTKLDMYVFRKFRHKYVIVIAYLKSMKMIRNTVASLNMWKLMSLLRK